MKEITILGSTGSIGVNTLDVISSHQDKFNVTALTANKNLDVLAEQCFKYQPEYAVMTDEASASKLEEKLKKERKHHSSQLKKEERKITGNDIAQLVHKRTGIPVQKIIEDEADKLSKMEVLLRQRVVGQDHVITSIANAIRRNRSGLRNPNSPIASFLFLVPGHIRGGLGLEINCHL